MDTFKWSDWELENQRHLVAQVASDCPACGKPVKKGVTCLWIRAVAGLGERKKAVLFHPACVEQAG